MEGHAASAYGKRERRRLNELSIDQFLEAILHAHGATARFNRRVDVQESFNGEIVWAGEVLVFDLLDHPIAKTCYAWSIDSRVTAVLHEGPVDSPGAAVRAAIAGEHHCAHCGARFIQGDRRCPNCGHSIRSR